jgi:hypothetical protein
MGTKEGNGSDATPSSPLALLAVLIGEWTKESPQFPEFRGTAKFEWIEGGSYMAVRDDVEEGELPPSSTWIIGGDDVTQDCTCLYCDSRGVRRVYQTRLADDVWEIWRSAPEFNQRFFGRVVDGGSTIAARWETSKDGLTWAKDFDLVYRKIS